MLFVRGKGGGESVMCAILGCAALVCLLHPLLNIFFRYSCVID